MQFSRIVSPIVCLLPSELRIDLKEQLLTLTNLVNFEYRYFMKPSYSTVYSVQL